MRLKVAQQGTKENVARAQARQQPLPAAHVPEPRSIVASLLTLQRTHGNRFVQRLLNGATIQRKCACGGSPGMAGECEECRKKKLILQRRSIDQAEPSEVPPIVHKVLRSPGQPLDPATRSFMESRFGLDFSQVRVHTDARAAESARAVNALAYTVGRDIVFGTGLYAPGIIAGRRLLAHELTHVVQQGIGHATLQGELHINTPSNGSEREADKVAETNTDHSVRPMLPGFSLYYSASAARLLVLLYQTVRLVRRILLARSSILMSTVMT